MTMTQEVRKAVADARKWWTDANARGEGQGDLESICVSFGLHDYGALATEFDNFLVSDLLYEIDRGDSETVAELWIFPDQVGWSVLCCSDEVRESFGPGVNKPRLGSSAGGFNLRCPVGSRVHVITDQGSVIETTTAGMAYISGETPIVHLSGEVDGFRGSYLLSRVSPVVVREEHMPLAPLTGSELRDIACLALCDEHHGKWGALEVTLTFLFGVGAKWFWGRVAQGVNDALGLKARPSDVDPDEERPDQEGMK